VPIILITVVGDEPIRNAALEAGVIDFLVKPVRPRELRSRCRNLLALRQQQQNLKTRAHELERQLLARMHELDERERELLHRLARATSLRDGGSLARCERMARYSGLIAEAMGLSEDDVKMIELAAPLHDIGKIGIPDALLLKRGPLEPAERTAVAAYPKLGYDILRDSSSRIVQQGATIALSHRERWDGAGYPDGLRGGETPLPARIVAVASAFEAMTADRPYRPALPTAEAFAALSAGAGTQFDPAVVDAIVQRRERVEEVHRYFGAGTAA
jgi:two-component system response regulator RpfG